MIQIKACPRCAGDMMLEEYLGESELVCLQCGNRISPPAETMRQPTPIAFPSKKAA